MICWSSPKPANTRHAQAGRAHGRTRVRGLASLLLWLASAGSGCGEELDTSLEADALVANSARGCERQPRTVVGVTPPRFGPVTPGTVVTYDVRVKNNDPRACGKTEFTIVTERSAIEAGLSWVDWTSATIAPGQIANLRVSVRGDATLEPGVYGLPFRVVRAGEQTDLPGAAGRAEYVVGGAAAACEVRSRSELLVRDLTVVEDPVRTRRSGPGTGAWTFASLIESAARTPADAPALVEQLFRGFAEAQQIGGFTVGPRSDAEQFMLKPWRKGADGKLDLERVPLRLLAIVNRMDQRDLAAGHAGEAAFVFGMFNPLDFTLGAPTRRAREVDFTVVLEYRLPAQTADDVLAWARAWHQLGSVPFPSEQYNVALEALTRRFTARGVSPAAPNGSALLRVRTNDGKLAGSRDWQLRELALSPETGLLVPLPTRRTPDNDSNETPRLARWINENAQAIREERHEVPAYFEEGPFAAGASQNDGRVWDAVGIEDLEVRHRFALQTCNGCHGAETRTDRKHISARNEGELSFLSSYLTGKAVVDPITAQPRSFGELARRRADLLELLCGSDPAAAAARRPTILPIPAGDAASH